MTEKVKLFIFPRSKEISNFSPFCIKLEAFLRMAEIPYETKISLNLKRTPYYKMPFIQIDGETIGDSGLVIDYLTEKYNIQLDVSLSTEQYAIALGLRRLMEEHLYWVGVYSRWLDPVGWKNWQRIMTYGKPWFAKYFINAVRKGVGKQLYGQGLGRLPKDRIYELGIQDLQAVADFLQDKPFVFGDTPTSLDATVYGLIGALWFMRWDYPLKTFIQNHKPFHDYYARMTERYFPEYPSVPSR